MDFPWFDPESRIERATEIVPLWVAECVVNEAGAALGVTLPEDWPVALAAKAERSFAQHRQFHRLISAPCGGLPNLRKFMRHWLCGHLARERRSLFRRVPHSFTLGLALPQWRARGL